MGDVVVFRAGFLAVDYQAAGTFAAFAVGERWAIRLESDSSGAGNRFGIFLAVVNEVPRTGAFAEEDQAGFVAAELKILDVLVSAG